MAVIPFEVVSQHRCFNGTVGFYKHEAASTACSMKFSVFTPPQAQAGRVPVLYYLAGLTCTEETFMIKAGAQRVAAELGIMLVAPDTSPRGVKLPGDSDSWDFGVGAGFYVDATVEPWSRHYRMYTYITQELRALIEAQFPADPARTGIFGHSMGGHGALTHCAAQSRIVSLGLGLRAHRGTEAVPWGQKAFTGYLGPDRGQWAQYDATEIVVGREGCRRPAAHLDRPGAVGSVPADAAASAPVRGGREEGRLSAARCGAMKAMTTATTSSPPSCRITCVHHAKILAELSSLAAAMMALRAATHDPGSGSLRLCQMTTSRVSGVSNGTGSTLTGASFARVRARCSGRVATSSVPASMNGISSNPWRGGAHVEVGAGQAANQLLQRERVTARPTKHMGQGEVLRFGDGVAHCGWSFDDGARPSAPARRSTMRSDPGNARSPNSRRLFRPRTDRRRRIRAGRGWFRRSARRDSGFPGPPGTRRWNTAGMTRSSASADTIRVKVRCTVRRVESGLGTQGRLDAQQGLPDRLDQRQPARA